MTLTVECEQTSNPSAVSPHIIFTIGNQAEIPASELPHIFEKFYRVPNADPWKQGGTGLGLALVQRLIAQLEGDIRVESGNDWTHFSIHLPLSECSLVDQGSNSAKSVVQASSLCGHPARTIA